VVGVCTVAAAAVGYPVPLIVVLALLTLLWVSNALQANGHGNLVVIAVNAVKRLRKGNPAP
jgi:hypothetical protein